MSQLVEQQKCDGSANNSYRTVGCRTVDCFPEPSSVAWWVVCHHAHQAHRCSRRCRCRNQCHHPPSFFPRSVCGD